MPLCDRLQPDLRGFTLSNWEKRQRYGAWWSHLLNPRLQESSRLSPDVLCREGAGRGFVPGLSLTKFKIWHLRHNKGSDMSQALGSNELTYGGGYEVITFFWEKIGLGDSKESGRYAGFWRAGVSFLGSGFWFLLGEVSGPLCWR